MRGDAAQPLAARARADFAPWFYRTAPAGPLDSVTTTLQAQIGFKNTFIGQEQDISPGSNTRKTPEEYLSEIKTKFNIRPRFSDVNLCI